MLNIFEYIHILFKSSRAEYIQNMFKYLEFFGHARRVQTPFLSNQR
jgi:hypothetical protein